MCTHSIDDLLPHAPLHYAATGEMVKGSLKNNNDIYTNRVQHNLGHHPYTNMEPDPDLPTSEKV